MVSRDIAESGKSCAIANITGPDRVLTFRNGAEATTDVRLIINARVECAPERLDLLVRDALIRSVDNRYTDEVVAWRYLQPGRPQPTYHFEEMVA